MNVDKLKKLIHNIPDFPQKGVNFKDITPILRDSEAFIYVVQQFCTFARKHQVTAILAPEARGFIFGAAVAYQLKIKFVPARKPGKLPSKTFETAYELEYGNNKLQIHQDAFQPTDQVMIIDDLIATAGTVQACINLVKIAGATTKCIATLISLSQFEQQHDFNNIPMLRIISF